MPSRRKATIAINYGEADFGYDALERQNRVSEPDGCALGLHLPH